MVDADDAVKLQNALDLITDRAREWQLQISIKKCSVVTVGQVMFDAKYCIDGCTLPRTMTVCDLGVTTTYDLSSTQHINEITAKAHRCANCILRCFVSGDVDTLIRAFIVYVRPIVECNSIIWSPHLTQDIQQIEKVQRRFAKRLGGLNCLSYPNRLNRHGLPSLELRRLHLDLIFCYKIVFGLVTVSFSDFFEYNVAAKTTDRAYKLFKARCNNNIRRHFFCHRLINVWNALPSTVNLQSLCTFKRSIKEIDFAGFLKGF